MIFKSQIVGIPKEIFPGENRVSISPEGVEKLINMGYRVQVEKNAGVSAKFTNKMYEEKGAKILSK